MPSGRLPSLHTDLAATLLVEALYTTDDIACARYDVCRATLTRIRRRFSAGTDPELMEKVAIKKAAFDRQWAEEFPLMLKKGIRVLNECLDAISKDEDAKKNPQTIAAIAGALKIGADVHYTGKIIDARIAESTGQADSISSEASSGSEEYPN